MAFEEKNSEVIDTLTCANCGAILHYQPGTDHLRCEYCGTENTIPQNPSTVEKPGAITTELTKDPYEEYLDATNLKVGKTTRAMIVSCKNCGASTTLRQGILADSCPFCAAPLVIDQSELKEVREPNAVLPFMIDNKQALQLFKSWLKGLWFAPDALVKNTKEFHGTNKLQGIYLPYWNFDADTTTPYEGQRGEYYYVTETYYVTVNGRQEARTRQVRHTRWYHASGTVFEQFRDMLVKASQSIDKSVEEKLEPWNIQKFRPFDERYLSGFKAEIYQVEPPQAYKDAQRRMDAFIYQSICQDIGGDVQRVDGYDTNFHDVKIQYTLLPVWISSYHFNKKLYNFYINACTGEVIGERPYSFWKIFFLVISILAAIGVIYWLYQQGQ